MTLELVLLNLIKGEVVSQSNKRRRRINELERSELERSIGDESLVCKNSTREHNFARRGLG